MTTRLLPLALLLLVAGPAQAGGAASYAGAWTFDESRGEREAAQAAVDDVAAQYTPIVRGLVKSRLREAVAISTTLTLEPGENTMTITSDFSSWTSDLAATEVPVLNPEGETVLLKRWLDEGVLKAVGSLGPSTSSFAFHLSEDGKSMTLHVRTQNPRLKKDLAYKLTYVRE
jgi:hypothetical protein